jgi:hypothetical protein
MFYYIPQRGEKSKPGDEGPRDASKSTFIDPGDHGGGCLKTLKKAIDIPTASKEKRFKRVWEI